MLRKVQFSVVAAGTRLVNNCNYEICKCLPPQCVVECHRLRGFDRKEEKYSNVMIWTVPFGILTCNAINPCHPNLIAFRGMFRDSSLSWLRSHGTFLLPNICVLLRKNCLQHGKPICTSLFWLLPFENIALGPWTELRNSGFRAKWQNWENRLWDSLSGQIVTELRDRECGGKNEREEQLTKGEVWNWTSIYKTACLCISLQFLYIRLPWQEEHVQTLERAMGEHACERACRGHLSMSVACDQGGNYK